MGAKKILRRVYMSESLSTSSFRGLYRLRPSSNRRQQPFKITKANRKLPPFQPPLPIMPSSRSSRSVSSKSSSSGSSSRTDKPRGTVQDLIDTLTTHRVNTLTDLCRIERIAASCESEDDARAFQQPMTSAWVYYVNSNSLLTELRGFTRNFPFSSEILDEAHRRVRCDPESNRSWNLAWLCLTRMRDDGLVVMYAAAEASKNEMWGGKTPSTEEVGKLADCFEREWMRAIETMLRHWASPPTWY